MSSARYAVPLRLELRRSRRLAFYLVLVHCGALAMLPLLPLGVPISAVLAGLILLALVRNYATHVLMRGDGSVVALVWMHDGDWQLIERSGQTRVCRLRPDSYVHPQLAQLNFTGARRCSITLLPDSLDSESFRRLRVRLGLRKPDDEGPDYSA